MLLDDLRLINRRQITKEELGEIIVLFRWLG